MTVTPPINLDIYGKIAVQQAYRILGFGDLDAGSPNYGCFDRYYWHYRQVDFINSRFQEAAHFLAALYHYNHAENRFYQKPKIKAWADAAVRVWESIQCPDGSFNEYWPYERSFCVTSFTTYSAAETCRLLSLNPPKDALYKAAKWIHEHENREVLNQMACSAVALRISGEVLQDDNVLKWADERVKTVLSMQHPDGYFEEYGGADTGYLTITLECLAKYYERSRDEAVAQAMQPAFRYLDGIINENGSYEYRNTSRKTQYFYPYGFSQMGEWDLLSRHIKGLERNEVLNPAWMDDRYVIPLSTDYVQAVLCWQK